MRSRRLAWRRRWPHVRAAFLALHLCAVTVAALPTTAGVMRRADWESPAAHAELAAWSERLETVGVSIEPDPLRERAWAVASGWAKLHAMLRRPFRLYYAACGTDQMWRLFAAPDRFPTRLWIDVQVDGAWVPVYREHSTEHAWRASLLASHRMRGIVHLYGEPGRRPRLAQLAELLGDAAARSFPDATAIRLRYMRGPLPTPAQLRNGEAAPLRPAAEIVQVLP